MNGKMKSHRGVVAMIGILLALLLVTPRGQAADSSVLSPENAHFGKTYAEWSVAWWQWALSIPVHAPPFSSKINHPLVDLTGAQCDVGQSGKVWFLGGVFSVSGAPAVNTLTRTDCTVPSSKALFFPIINSECSILEGSRFGCADTEEALRIIVPAGIDPVDPASNLFAELDGNIIPMSKSYRVGYTGKPFFSFTLPPDDILSAIGEGPYSPGTYYPALDDGYYLMLAPLPKGKHTLHFIGTNPAFNFTLDVTYILYVE